MASPVTGVREWLHERFDLDGIKALAQKKKVPVHRYSYWYFLGGMTLFLFGVQVLTGALLLLYYRPGADEAFESVQLIIDPRCSSGGSSVRCIRGRRTY